MPIIKAAIKHARQSEVRRDRRVPYKTRMKTFLRQIREAAKEGKTAEAQKLVPAAFKAIDMAAKKNIIHWKNAARKKSLISKMIAAKKK
jgi:small subunit ribosomal protein S20